MLVPNKTIYVSDGDLPLYQRAQELAGGNLSAAIAAALRRYVDVEEAGARASTRSPFASAPAAAERSASPGSSSASWTTRRSRVETFRVYRGRTGKYVLHVERTAGLGWSTRRASRPAGAAISASVTSATGARPAESTLEVVESLDDLREGPGAALRHGGALSPPAEVEDLDIERRSPPAAGEVGVMTATARPTGHPRPSAAQVVRQAGRPRRHRPRHRRRHGLRAPRPERRRQDDHGPHPVDPARRRRRRGAGRRPRRRARPGRGAQRHRRDRPVLGGRRAVHRRGEPPAHGRSPPPRQAEGRRRVAELLERFDLVDAAKKPVATYSGGMRRRLDLAMTLVGDPRIIFLDEPTAASIRAAAG